MQSVDVLECPQPKVLKQFLQAELREDRASCIDSHVAHCTVCQEVLESLLEDVGGCSEIERLLKEQAGTLYKPLPDSIGGYRILGKLGQGSFGIVYHAYDDGLDRAVAIKAPHASVVQAVGGVETYLKEARMLARLDHPNIVHIYEAKPDGNGSCYLVSQLIDGCSLDACLADRRLELEQAVELVAAIADALQHAHEQGIVHRDVKPANILLDAKGRPYLADFGLALKEEDIGRGAGFLGTPAYMSPEQARGDGHRVDGRTDIFSLGVVLYKLLTGRRPFLAETIEDQMNLIVHVDAPSVRQKDRSIPRELDRICAKALARAVSERYRSASDMVDDLNAWLNSQRQGVCPGRRPVTRFEGIPRIHDQWLSFADEPSVTIDLQKTTGGAGQSHSTLEDKRSIGGFQLRTRLGSGGMGTVYRAWQPSAEREVALKCISLSDSTSQTRFATEILALGKVEHPNLVSVYTSGVDASRFYFAMELVEGTSVSNLLRHLPPATSDLLNDDRWQDAVGRAADEARAAERRLEDLIDDEPLPNGDNEPPDTFDVAEGESHGSDAYVRRVAAIIHDIALAAEALHENGVIHRDIKPDNILLARDGKRAVLMDLGIAKLTQDDDGRVTRTRQFVGSLRYASPEQLIDSGLVDHRTDVYSLGATLWEMLALRPIYGIDEELSDSRAMLRIEIEEPDPVHKYNRAVPLDVQAIIQKCLEKNPQHRYASAAELAEDLNCWLQGQPVKARPVGPVTRFFRRFRRRPLAPTLTLTIVMLGIALFAALVPWPEPRSPEIRVGIKPWVGFSPLVVASEMDLCEGVDLKLVPVRNTTDVRQRILSRELDMAPYLVDSHALARATRTPAKVVLQLDVSLTADAVVARRGIDSFSDLKGKRIAYMHHEAPHFLLLSLCDQHGLDTGDFQHVRAETAKEAVDVFIADMADAVVSYEPFLTTALARPGARRLASAADEPGTIIDILTAREDYLENNRDRVKTLIAAWMQALDLLQRGDPEALAIACRFLGSEGSPITVEQYQAMAQGMTYAGKEENLNFFRRNAQGRSEFHERMDAAQRRWDRHQQLNRLTKPADADGSDVFLEMYGP